MHDLFTRGVDAHGHLRPPYEEAPELYKQSELGWIPKEWEVVSVDEIARTMHRHGHQPYHGILEDRAMAFSVSANILNRRIDFHDGDYVDDADRLLTSR